MYKRLLTMVVGVGLVYTLVLPVRGLNCGTIRILPKYSDQAVTGGTVTISRVGVVSENGYLITGKNNLWSIAADELFLPETATWVKKHAKGEEITQMAENLEAFCFRNLEAGVYLVTQKLPEEDFVPFHPFLVELPVAGEVWEAEAYPQVQKLLEESPKTADHPAPIIAAMGLVFSFFALLVLGDKRRK